MMIVLGEDDGLWNGGAPRKKLGEQRVAIGFEHGTDLVWRNDGSSLLV
jgi:hypothetical protein